MQSAMINIAGLLSFVVGIIAIIYNDPSFVQWFMLGVLYFILDEVKK